MPDYITFDFATRDDCLDQMVPSDLRKLITERDQAKEEVVKLRKDVALLRAEMVCVNDELIKELNAQIGIVQNSKDKAWENRRIVGPDPNAGYMRECEKRIRIAKAAIRSQSTRLMENSVKSLASMSIYKD